MIIDCLARLIVGHLTLLAADEGTIDSSLRSLLLEPSQLTLGVRHTTRMGGVMESPELHTLERELQRVYGSGAHVNLAAGPTPPPLAEVTRMLAVLQTLPDGAGEVAIIRALNVPPEHVERRGATS